MTKPNNPAFEKALTDAARLADGEPWDYVPTGPNEGPNWMTRTVRIFDGSVYRVNITGPLDQYAGEVDFEEEIEP